MGAKIISFALVCVLLISSFSVFAFADASVLSDDVYVDDYVSSDFNNYLNVEEYKKKAGTEGYTDLLLVGVSTPVISVDEDNSDPSYVDLRVSFHFYFYNPMLLPVRAYLSSYDAFVGNAEVMLPGDSDYKKVGLYTGIGTCDRDAYSQMFIAGSFIHSLGKFKASDNINYSDYVESLTYKFKDVSFVTFEGKRYDFVINDSVSKDIIDYTLGTSSPLSDLASFLNTDVATIKKNYPLSDTADYRSVVFLYVNLALNELYVYLYDSSGWDKRNLSVSAEIGLNDDENYGYSFELVNTEGSIAKFKVLKTESIFSKIDIDKDRKYCILKVRVFWDVSAPLIGWTQDIYEINGTFDFEYSGSESERNIYSLSNQIVFQEVGSTYYRLNSSNTAEGYYKTLSSVYFSLPNFYFELDDDNYLNDRWLERITGQFDSFFSDYTLVASDEEYLNVLKKWKIDDRDIVAWATDLRSGGNNGDYLFCGVGYDSGNLYGLIMENFSIEKVFSYDVINDSFYFTEDFEELDIDFDEEYISSQFQKHKNEVEHTDFEFTKEDSFDLLSRDSMTLGELINNIGLFEGLWSYWFGFTDSVDESIYDIKAFDTLSGDELRYALSSMSKEEFCDTYYVAESDYAAIYDRMRNCEANNETFIFLRIDVFDYYAKDVDFILDKKDWWGYSQFYDTDKNVFCYKTKIYSGFEVLELELCNQYDSKIYNVSMQPISFVSGVTTPDPYDPSEDLPSVEDVVSGLMPEFPTFDFSFLKPLAAIAGVVLLVVVVYFGINVAYKVSIIGSTNANVRSNKRKRNK